MTHVYATVQIMMVKYDLYINSESTRWQCHSFLTTAPWSINFLLKYPNVIMILITSVLKNLGRYLKHLPHLQNMSMKKYFPKKKQKRLYENGSWLPAKHLSHSWLFRARVPVEAFEGCWIWAWSYPAEKSEHHTLKSTSPQKLLSFTAEK